MKAWKLYYNKLNSGLKIDGSQRAHLNRFYARFELVRNFEKMDISNTSRETSNGYSSIFAIFLAFNAA
jgi:hypothetical protein